MMRHWCCLGAYLALTRAEIGLTVESDIGSISGLPLRVVDSRLSIGGEGPIFQGTYDDGSLVLSDRIVSQEAAGSGIGLRNDGLLIVTFNSSTTFYDRDGWLEYSGDGIFALKQNGRSYDVYADRPDLAEVSPAMLQLAALIYPNATSTVDDTAQANRASGRIYL